MMDQKLLFKNINFDDYFNWRIFHGQIVTEKRLKIMKLSNGMCILCKADIEDVTHVFTKCPYFKPVRSCVEFIVNHLGIGRLLPFNMIVGFLDSDKIYDVINMVLSMARWVTWKTRCTLKFEKTSEKQTPAEYQFKYSLKKHTVTLLKSNAISDIEVKNELNGLLCVL